MFDNLESSGEGIVIEEASWTPRNSCPIPAKFIQQALDIFTAHDIGPPDQGRLELLVRAAMETQYLLLMAAVIEPTTDDFGAVFDCFISCAAGLDMPGLCEEPQ